MKLDNKWYELYEYLYGTKFNRIMTIGTISKGYENYPITSMEDIKELIDKFYPKNEFYISLYNYNSDKSIISWNRLDGSKFEKYAKKNCILFRFRQNTDIIKEEIMELSEIEKFMFIRRSINLGSNKKIISDIKNVYNIIEKLFNIKSFTMFNGYNECYLYIYLNEIELKNPTLTYYYFYKFIENLANTVTLTYSKIEPFSQIVTLPGSQNNASRLYAKPYDIELPYIEIIKNSENKNIDIIDINRNQDTSSLESLLKTVDAEISKRKSEGNNDTWNYDLDELFNENRN